MERQRQRHQHDPGHDQHGDHAGRCVRTQDIKGITGTQTATFAGQTVHATDALAMYTYAGDANLDGKINADDYFQIDSNYNKNGNNAAISFHDGDFNYDGKRSTAKITS